MRVTGGELKGRIFSAPKRDDFRPTSEKVREAIFSSINSTIDINGSLVLDLYAGSGALGIEALSRGASQVTFVEKDRVLVNALMENLKDLGLEKKASVIGQDVITALKVLGGTFNLVLADPPYAAGEEAELFAALMNAALIGPSTLFVFESRFSKLSASVNRVSDCKLELIKEKRYGDTLVRYFKLPL